MIKSAGPGNDKGKDARGRTGRESALSTRSRSTPLLANAGQQAAWVALKPETGRTHQLRFHMAEIGCAILATGNTPASARRRPGWRWPPPPCPGAALAGAARPRHRDRRRAAAHIKRPSTYLASMNVRFRTSSRSSAGGRTVSAQLLTQAHDLLAAGQAEEASSLLAAAVDGRPGRRKRPHHAGLR